jgi:membrane protein implicated in regulation of membrane protease activity
MENSKKACKNQIRAALAALLMGMLMRVLHWPYAAGIIFSSFAAVLILYTIRFSRKNDKKTIDFIKMALVLFWTTNGLLRILDFPYTLIFQIGTALTFIAWFAMEGTSYFMGKDRKVKNSLIDIIWNCVMVIGVLTIILGGLMHLLSWDYAIPTLTVGLTIVTSFILKDIFSPPKAQKKDSNNEELYS